MGKVGWSVPNSEVNITFAVGRQPRAALPDATTLGRCPTLIYSCAEDTLRAKGCRIIPKDNRGIPLLPQRRSH